MTYTYEQLSAMTVADLRKIADEIEHEELKGHSTMHKEKLLPALCKALGIEAHVHHEVVGLDKKQLKGEIRMLKKKRDTALSNKDRNQLKEIRLRISSLKKRLRRAIV